MKVSSVGALGAATVIALALTGCSSSDNPTLTVSGTAATGAAVANGTVQAISRSGTACASTTTQANGTYTIDIAPCGTDTPVLLVATVPGSGGTLYSGYFPNGSTTVNLTQLTTAIILATFGQGTPPTLAAAINRSSQSAVNTAETAIKTQLANLFPQGVYGVNWSTINLFSTAFIANSTGIDLVLDHTAVTLPAQAGSALSIANTQNNSQIVVSNPGGSVTVAAPAPGRGALNASTTVTTLPKATIDSNTTASGLMALTGAAKCDVQVQALNYKTVGAAATESTTASAVLLIPKGDDPSCKGPLPLLGYAKGTDVTKSRTLANPTDSETFSLAAMFAAQGYVVVATDYLGYAQSAYSYHPYLHADSEATSVIDSLRAARGAMAALNLPNQGLSGKVMLSGYSQGGHSSMAAHRAIEKDYALEFKLVAGGHMSGPYNLTKSIVQGADTPIAGGQFFVPFFITAWQKVYNGAVYNDVADVFNAPYTGYIESLLPSAIAGADTYTTLVTSGKLPASNYLTTLFKSSFIQDLKTNPDNGVVVAARKNDLLGWNPRAKTALCGGLQDPTVSFTLHAKETAADFASRGVTVPVIDVDPIIVSRGPVDLAAYHGTSVPPLCMAQLRASLFNPLR